MTDPAPQVPFPQDDDTAWPEEGGATDNPKPVKEETGWDDGGEDGEGRSDES